MNIKFRERNSNRILTWVEWSHCGSHPTKLLRNGLTVSILETLRIDIEYVVHNGEKTDTCYLFFRKFSPRALTRLLNLPQIKLMKFNEKLAMIS